MRLQHIVITAKGLAPLAQFNDLPLPVQQKALSDHSAAIIERRAWFAHRLHHVLTGRRESGRKPATLRKNLQAFEVPRDGQRNRLH